MGKLRVICPPWATTFELSLIMECNLSPQPTQVLSLVRLLKASFLVPSPRIAWKRCIAKITKQCRQRRVPRLLRSSGLHLCSVLLHRTKPRSRAFLVNMFSHHPRRIVCLGAIANALGHCWGRCTSQSCYTNWRQTILAARTSHHQN
jgi:hypothetical protein